MSTNRRDFLKLMGVGLLALLFPPKRKKKKKKMIHHINSSDSTYKAGFSTYNWVHPAPSPVAALRGILVTVAVYGTQTVTAVTATAGGVVRALTPVESRYANNVRIELWLLLDTAAVDKTIDITLSGSGNSSATASTYAYLGPIEESSGSTSSGSFGGFSWETLRNSDIMFICLATETLSGVTDNFPGMNRRVTIEHASGTHIVVDRGPFDVPQEVEMGWLGIGASDDTSAVYAKLINNNMTAIPIG